MYYVPLFFSSPTTQLFEGKRDVILFCIDCSESMLELRDDLDYEDFKTCHLFKALEAAMQIQKRKIIVGPSDSVGIMFFNTVRSHDDTFGVRLSDIMLSRQGERKMDAQKSPNWSAILSYFNLFLRWVHPRSKSWFKSLTVCRGSFLVPLN